MNVTFFVDLSAIVQWSNLLNNSCCSNRYDAIGNFLSLLLFHDCLIKYFLAILADDDDAVAVAVEFSLKLDFNIKVVRLSGGLGL